MIGWQALYLAAQKCEQKKDWTRAISIYKSIIQSSRNPDPRVLYHLGNAQFSVGDDLAAEKNIKLAINKAPNNASWHYRLGFIQERNKEFATALISYDRAIELDPSKLSWQRRKSVCHDQLGQEHASLRILRTALTKDPRNLLIADTLAQKLRTKGKIWEEIEILQKVLPFQESNAEWLFRLAEACDSMGQYAKAGKYYHQSNNLGANSALNYFKEGRAWRKASEKHNSKIAFNLAISHDTKYRSSEFGIGAFYQAMGDWETAAHEYQDFATIYPESAELQYKLALALERCYFWEEASKSYASAIRLNPLRWDWHFRRGFSLERMERWHEAAECYRFAAEHAEKPKHEWFYRLGFVLTKVNNHQTACEAFLKMRPGMAVAFVEESTRIGSVTPETYEYKIISDAESSARSTVPCVKISELAEKHGYWRSSIRLLTQEIQRVSTHEADLYYRLGRANYAVGNYCEGTAAFLQMHIFSEPHGIDMKNYRKDRGLFEIMQYTAWTENLPLDENVVFYESFHSDSISCNPLAIYRELRDDPKYGHLRHVWSVNDSTIVPQDVAEDARTVTILRNSDAYRRSLATAAYLVSNVTFHAWFVRRDGQKYLNTWHGTPIKTLGKDIRSGYLEHKNVARNFLQATHVLTGNQHTTSILTKKYDVEHIWSAKVAEIGYPRVDQTLNLSKMRRDEIRDLLSIPKTEPRRPTILYAPTWRGGLDTRHFDIDRLVHDLGTLNELDADILFQAHHYTEALLAELDIPVTTIPKEIETNELLAVVDILITDYSSIAFDFLATKKPLFFYTYDAADFDTERGLYFRGEDLPGYEAQTVEGLVEGIRKTLDGTNHFDATMYIEKFCPMDDGMASRRAVKFFFEDDEADAVEIADVKRPSLLFHHSFIPNGITTSIQNLISTLRPDEYMTTVVVSAETTASDPLRIAKLSELPAHVSVIGRTGRQLFTPEEKWIVDKLNRNRTLTSAEQWNVYGKSFAREYRRIFGAANFDAIIEFEGYSTFWSSILGFADSTASKSIYLHNDMMSEWKQRFQYLESLFRIYPYFDNLISVSSSISDENSSNLSDRFNVPRSRFIDCVNQIDPSRIKKLALSNIDADIEAFIKPNVIQLVSIGRLSPEKDHAKLIHAVKAINTDESTNIRVQLVILGDGPLRAALTQLIESLGMEQSVYLGGLRENPFPVLKRADAFILSSNHEGQPMVLLEAMVLGKKIISTDIVGTRHVLQSGMGKLVENSMEGLVQGIRALLADSIPDPSFDEDAYISRASLSFARATISREVGALK
ncbi:CDP-glycerol glycerophosphotransferase family protein [Specibacter sp. RAF43]|uniref:CDP-glycerol glycerophosphotransferase family protein n=1 Tax=Specibacter sp. RAF43 TaxID=3233057 RepID=UPI003F9ABCE1